MAIQKITSGILADGAIVAADIANGSITTAKIADGNVTAAKLATGAALPSQSGNTTYYLTTDGTNSIWKAQTALAVANTQVTGLVTASQIANVANTQVTGSIEATQVGTTVSQLFGMRNRIINGAMEIDQRRAGASVTPTGDQTYTVDRWGAGLSASSKYSVQQNAGSVTPPAGFTNYLGITSTSAYSVSASDYFYINQKIEGYNVSDLAYGTASAKTVTLSFWVRSSLTGTFGGGLYNETGNDSYPFSYTISLANTWEQKSITIAGDTANALATTNGIGILVAFGLGVGSTYSATAGSWQSGLFVSTTGATSVVGTNGATWYLTGVQLEVGTSATPFERRLYNQEFANCQRYLPATYLSAHPGWCYSTTGAIFSAPFSVPSRVYPSGLSVTPASCIVYNGALSTATPSAVAWNGATVYEGNIATTTAAILTTGQAGGFTGNILWTGCEL